jgi:diguanylate cyclase (GGDEF)-like protein
MFFRTDDRSSRNGPPRSGRFPGRRPGGESPEQINHRYHLIRVTVTLITMGSITMLIGLAALVDPENLHPFRYFAGCAVVGLVTGGLLLFLLRRRPQSTSVVETVMLVGLAVTVANTIYGGLLDVDPWWQVCSYLVVLMVAGGVCIRRWNTFVVYIVAVLVAWVIVIESAGESRTFLFDTYVLMVLGAVVAGAILLMFKAERRRVTGLNEELLAAASHDQLTGILNRNGLLQAVETIARGRRSADAAWCAYIDVDYFKTINDRFGHDVGDEVLEAVGIALTEAQVPGSLSARWGGDEFVVVGFADAPSERGLEAVVNDAIQALVPSATVSVGMTRRAPGESIGLPGLMKRADQQMYQGRSEVRSRAASASAGAEPA